MGQRGFRYRAVLGGLLGGSLALLGTILVDQTGTGRDASISTASIGTLAWFGAFIGVFGFQKGSQVWNDTLDRIDDTFST